MCLNAWSSVVELFGKDYEVGLFFAVLSFVVSKTSGFDVSECLSLPFTSSMDYCALALVFAFLFGNVPSLLSSLLVMISICFMLIVSLFCGSHLTYTFHVSYLLFFLIL